MWRTGFHNAVSPCEGRRPVRNYATFCRITRRWLRYFNQQQSGFGKLDENVQSVTLYKICHLRFDTFSVTVLPVTGNTNHPVPSVVWDGGENLTKGVKEYAVWRSGTGCEDPWHLRGV